MSSAICLTLLFLISCQKSDYLTIGNTKDKDNFTISEAKSWIDKNVFINTSFARENAYNNLFKNLWPVWDKAVTSKDDQYDVIECPLETDNAIGFSVVKSGMAVTSNNINGKVSLVLLKSKKNSSIQAGLMNIFSNNASSAENISYRNRTSFSGTVFFTTLSGEFVNGWLYENGKVIRKSGKKQTSVVAREGAGDECYNYTVYTYQRVCTYWNDNSVSCSPWTIVGSSYQEYCVGNGNGGYNPDVYVEIQLTPCDLADSLANNADFKAKFDSLKNMTTQTKEYGYTYKNNSTAGLTTNSIEGKNGEAGIFFTLTDKIDGIMHSHYTGLLSIFSPDDIFAIAQTYSLGKMVDPSTFTLAVVTANGTQYLLKIDNITKFNKFATDMVNNSTLDLYSFAYQNLYGINPGNNNDANEKAFLQYIQQTNSGLRLFKGNANFTEWQPKKVDTNGNIVNNPC